MRILVLNQYFHPDRSATGQLLTELCEDMAEAHEVYVVTGRPSYSPTAPTSSRGLISKERHGRVHLARVYSTGFDRSSMAGRLTNYGTYLLTSVVGALSIASPDVVVALTDPPPIGLIGAWTARARRCPFVLVTKDIFPEVAVRLGRLRNPSMIRVLRGVASRLFDSAVRIVSIGRDMSRRLEVLGVDPAKISLIHDWADGSRIRPLGRPSTLRAKLGWNGRFVVMHSGNVGLTQDLHTLIDAAALLEDQRDILFAVVGDGAARAGLERKVRSRRLVNVAFVPYQPKESLSESLGAADLHVVSLKRGLAGYIVPSKVYGIMAAGKPFVAAVEPDAEPALLASEHGCGSRIEPGDPGALAEGIVKMRNAPLEEMGARGRQAFERCFDRHLSTASYGNLLEEVVGHS